MENKVYAYIMGFMQDVSCNINNLLPATNTYDVLHTTYIMESMQHGIQAHAYINSSTYISLYVYLTVRYIELFHTNLLEVKLSM